MMDTKLGICLFLLILCNQYDAALDFKAARESHQARQLSDTQLAKVVQLEDSVNFRKLLDPILVPRVVGTDNHAAVREHIVQHMESLDWDVELDTFSATTPIGRLQFNNIVAKLNPQASRFLVLACHYDSKMMREGSFVGATDSAVPCAMMLHLASTLAQPLRKSRNNSDLSLQFIFFDGEEAFKQWGPKDSIYGAKHLARKLERLPFPPDTTSGTTHLSRMDMMVLLDLIGAPDPSFFSYFRNTEKWYNVLVRAEKRLAEKRLLTGYSYGMDGYPQHKYFQERSTYAGIEDDHIPFMQRGVPILHLITYPFPKVWHTQGDNLRALDFKVIANLNKIVRVFVAEYLKLDL